MDGILLIDKPKGWTSFDVVAKVRSILKKDLQHKHETRGFCTEMQGKEVVSNAEKRTKKYVERVEKPADTAMRSEPISAASSAGRQDWRCKCQVKVGHSGTLDPLATGLLVILVGSYCKKAQEYTKLDKVYEVEMTLGAISSTDDAEGVITETGDRRLGTGDIKSAITDFIGEIEQVPPAFSAIKVNGKRAYKLAREGKDVKLEPRKVTIYDIQITEVNYPIVKFTTHVSSGTYIRSLVRDIGEELDCGAYMSNLCRTKVGDFDLKNSIAISNLAPETLKKQLIRDVII